MTPERTAVTLGLVVQFLLAVGLLTLVSLSIYRNHLRKAFRYTMWAVGAFLVGFIADTCGRVWIRVNADLGSTPVAPGSDTWLFALGVWLQVVGLAVVALAIEYGSRWERQMRRQDEACLDSG